MKTLGNILWFFVTGIWSGLAWIIVGAIWCITIIGIPVGVQCFKLASLAFFPFKKEVKLEDGSPFNIIINIIWIALFGIELAVAHLVLGVLCCITIIGIPFGKQLFKLAELSLMPFGARIVEIE